jgi:hypothetical protein
MSHDRFMQLVRFYPKFGSFQRYIVFERQTVFPHNQRLIRNSVLVWEVQILQFFVKVLNSWINIETFDRTLILTWCGIISEMKISDSELSSFQGSILERKDVKSGWFSL